MASVTAVQKMDSELRCPACQRYFYCPVLLPCGHSLCTACAATALLPANESHVATAIQTTVNLIQTEASSAGTNTTVTSYSYSSASSTTGSSSAVGQQATQTGITSGSGSGATHSNNNSSNGVANSNSGVATSNHPDSDQVSVVSETDSGVVVSSRPGSYIGRLPILTAQHHTSLAIHQPGFICHGLMCPACTRIVALLDEKGIGHLPRNRALERILLKFAEPERGDTALGLQQQSQNPGGCESLALLTTATDPLNRPGGPLCQLCDDPDATGPESGGIVASSWCEQCEIFYCTACREKCHPSRGPLMRHVLHTASRGVEMVRQKRLNQPNPCAVHPHTMINLYCLSCHQPVCPECLENGTGLLPDYHAKHDVQPLNALCKTKKSELSHALQSLSEKARSGTESIQRLRSNSDEINQKMTESERQIDNQLSALIAALEAKRIELQQRVHETRDGKLVSIKDQIAHLTTMLSRSTSLIQFCIEMLKETDPSAFLIVSQALISRTQEAEHSFSHELDLSPGHVGGEVSDRYFPYPSSPVGKSVPSTALPPHERVRSDGTRSPIDQLGLQSSMVESLRYSIAQLSLHMHSDLASTASDRIDSRLANIEVPKVPHFLVQECLSERNLITLVWQPGSDTPVDRYTLELDDGANGNYRKVYRGPEAICTVEGLHFRSVYRARVKAHNRAGESTYSERLCLQTSDMTWFHLDGANAPAELLLTNGNRTVTSQAIEDRVLLGSTGLSRGVHYWEFTVDRCDPAGQPAFGVARQDTNKQTMLGLDTRSWSVYFDHKRSWFLHNGEHFERTDGGVRAGSVVGVRLDCSRGSLSYYLNDEPHGPIAFTNLPPGVYYPAVSLSRAIQITLHTGLDAPSESEESDEDSSGGGTGVASMATTVVLGVGQPTTSGSSVSGKPLATLTTVGDSGGGGGGQPEL